MTLTPVIELAQNAEESSILMRKHGKTFYFASRLLGDKRGKVVARLYALCRFIDDCADELEPGDSLRELKKLRSNLGLYTTDIDIEKAHLNELLNGAEFDATGGVIRTQKDLLIYCYRVAGAVGLMMNPLIGVKENSKANSFSIDLGIAMQLTNICRDVLEDAQNDRYYLPEEEREKFGISKEELRKQGPTPDSVKKLIKSYLDLADIYYKSAQNGYAYIPLRPRLAIHVAASLYREIGLVLKRNDYNSLSGRVYVPTWKKVFVSLKALGIIFRSVFWKKGRHKSSLHHALTGLPGVNLS